MIPCPAGSYCIQGEEYPRKCPKGTYNRLMRQYEESTCKDCLRGSNCNRAGIANYNDFLCPPGYWCPEGTSNPNPCPVGTFRPNKGAYEEGPIEYKKTASSAAKCFICVEGFYCDKAATTVPKLCPAGTYCPQGSTQFTSCPAGFYCPPRSAEPILCPAGNYCIVNSDMYFKCEFGTYCPPGSDMPIPCPDGMYGSGNINNYSVETGCKACGRGLYSTRESPNDCRDCPAGYVCLGGTSSATPQDAEEDGGYECPEGHYCPPGSFKEQECPIGHYSKVKGTKFRSDCIKCMTSYYNDVPGQTGCKKCGPTSTSFGGATTCECIGQFRTFVKSLGSCLCEAGYRPKNNMPDIDSSEDCELITQTACPIGSDVNIEGECVSSALQAEEICEVQCKNDNGGVLIEGTGTCQCNTIQDVDSVCDSECQKTSPKSKLNANGLLEVTDPVTGKTSEVDPSTLEGYYGSYQCKSTSGSENCNTFYMGMSEDGNFEFDYSTPSTVLKATGTLDRTDRSQLRVKRSIKKAMLEDENRERSRTRGLQTTNQKLLNPVICIPTGSAIFFQVDAQAGSYPKYLKNSILNTNQDFDYGPFIELANLINIQNVDV